MGICYECMQKLIKAGPDYCEPHLKEKLEKDLLKAKRLESFRKEVRALQIVQRKRWKEEEKTKPATHTVTSYGVFKL